MASDLKQTWNDIAHCLNDWGPPLKPSPEDLQINCQILARWHAQNPVPRARVFLCGVTPEIVNMPWPFPVELTAMDHAPDMVEVVWPGDVPGMRKALVGDWFNPGLPEKSQDIVIGDGGFGFYDCPDSQRRLLNALCKLLKPGGVFIYRHYAQISPRESLEQVLADLQSGRIGSFHAFKWRLAMAIQPDSTQGVRQQDIWQAWHDMNVDPTKLPQPGFSTRAVGTIDFYRNKQARLYFPTLEEFQGLIREHFSEVEVRYPSYELGERCPTVSARIK